MHRIKGTDFRIIAEDDNQVEVSFTRMWDPSLRGTHAPLNFDVRCVKVLSLILLQFYFSFFLSAVCCDKLFQSFIVIMR